VTVRPGTNGRPLRHGAALKLADQGTWPVPAVATSPRPPGTAPRRPRPGAGCTSSWPAAPAGKASTASCPSSRGTLIRLRVDHLPGDRIPGPLWLWSSRAGTDADAVNRAWQAFLRRFDIEHTFKFFRQVLG
jgi:hypothetical protein